MLTETRSLKKEIMDGESFDFAEYEVTLSEIALINRLSRGYAPTLEAIRKFAAKLAPGRPLRVLDIGFGYGDTLRAIHRWAKSAGVRVELFGVDLNPRAKELAESQTPLGFGIHYMSGDVFDLSDFQCDVMINSLFMHHLEDQQVIRLLRWMSKNARLGWFINDLHRHRVAFHFIRLATPLFGFNRLVRNDAPLSVARAFVRSDFLRYSAAAGLSTQDLSVRWHWPFRYGVTYLRPSAEVRA